MFEDGFKRIAVFWAIGRAINLKEALGTLATFVP